MNQSTITFGTPSPEGVVVITLPGSCSETYFKISEITPEGINIKVGSDVENEYLLLHTQGNDDDKRWTISQDNNFIYLDLIYFYPKPKYSYKDIRKMLFNYAIQYLRRKLS